MKSAKLIAPGIAAAFLGIAATGITERKPAREPDANEASRNAVGPERHPAPMAAEQDAEFSVFSGINSSESRLAKEWRVKRERLESLPDEIEREAMLAEWLGGIPESELARTALQLWDQPPSDVYREIAKRMLRRLAELDPAAAAAIAESLAGGDDREAVMRDVATVWADKDFASAVAWVRGWPDDERRAEGLIGVGYEAARQDAWTSLDLMADLPAGEARDELIRHAAAQCSTGDPAAMAQWARELSDPSLRERVIGTVAVEWSNQDPGAAASFALKELPSGRILEDTVVGIVQRWVQVEPAAARSWVERFPPGTLRDTAMQQVALLAPKTKS